MVFSKRPGVIVIATVFGLLPRHSPAETSGHISPTQPISTESETEAKTPEKEDPKTDSKAPKDQEKHKLPTHDEESPPESQLSGSLFQSGPALPFVPREKVEPEPSPYPDALCYDDFEDFRAAWTTSGSSWSSHSGAFHGRDVRPYTSPPRATVDFNATDLAASFRLSLGNNGRLNILVKGDDGFGNAVSLITISLTRSKVTVTRGGSTTSIRDPDIVRTMLSKRPVKLGKNYRTKKQLVSKATKLPSGWADAEISFNAEKIAVKIDGDEIYAGSHASHAREKHAITFVPGPATVSIDDVLVE